MSKIDDVISPLKMSALLWRRTILWENWRGPIFEKFLSRTKGDSPYPGEVILCTLAWMWLKITLNNKIKGTNQNASSLQELLRWNENILQNLKIMHIWRHNYVKLIWCNKPSIFLQAKTWYFVTIYYELKVVSLDWEICFKISQNIIFSGKMEWGMLSNFSDIDRSIMPKYTACVNFVFVDFLTLIYRSSVSNFTSFHKVDRDLQKYRHLQMALTYDVIDVSLRRTINDMVSKIL